MRLAEEVSSGAACAPVNTMAQTATIISAIEKLEGEYATVLTLVFYSCGLPMLQLNQGTSPNTNSQCDS
jgi:hypothetical protein